MRIAACPLSGWLRRWAGSESGGSSGDGGRELHGWHIGDPRANDADEIANSWLMRPRGAYVMGRNMFGPIRGDWDEDWSGWWAPNRRITRRSSC